MSAAQWHENNNEACRSDATPAQVTDAHRELAESVYWARETGKAGVSAQLIADSEAKACTELRADVERLTAGWDKYANMQIEMDALFARAERAEAELNESRYETVKAAQEGLRECIRAERAEVELAKARELLREIRDHEVTSADEADKFLRDHTPSELSKAQSELATERARLDWLELRGPWESWNGFGETGITLRENIRAAIDAAMKEEIK